MTIEKKITYVLTVSELFPKGHIREGEETGFVKKISAFDKIHTIRGNCDLWHKRAEKINAGKARLSVRIWSGKPYRSKQREVFEFDKVGIEKIQLTELGWLVNDIDRHLTTGLISKNDGLSEEDFKSWFKDKSFIKPMAVIHFTDFRYFGSK
jgi:hypothetical protein